MSGTIITPSNARKPDSASGYQYLVEKMRLAAEWRDVTFIPIYQQGDVVFYQGNMYIKKNVASNSLVNPASNTTDWISLENYIKEKTNRDFGLITYTSAGPSLAAYLNTMTDAGKADPNVFNPAVAAYKILEDKVITEPGVYTFRIQAAPSAYYTVFFFRTGTKIVFSLSYVQLPNNAPYLHYCTVLGTSGYAIPLKVTDQLGYTPANVGGTNWNANAVSTSLGYTPAKIGDSWISSKISFISPTGWTIVNNFASSPDLSNFTLFLPQSTNPNAFAFGLQKGASKIETGLYTVSVTPFLPGGSSFIGPSAFYLKPSSILGVNTYAIYNANVYLVLGSSNAVTYQTMVAAYDFNVIIYFSKNL